MSTSGLTPNPCMIINKLLLILPFNKNLLHASFYRTYVGCKELGAELLSDPCKQIMISYKRSVDLRTRRSVNIADEKIACFSMLEETSWGIGKKAGIEY